MTRSSLESRGRRVAVTGRGVISALGHDPDSVSQSLRSGRSGIEFMPEWADLELRSQISGNFEIEDRIKESTVPERRLETMGHTAMYAVLAAESAIAEAGLKAEDLAEDGCACLVSSGVGGLDMVYAGAEAVLNGRSRRVRPFAILQAMSSSANAHVTQTFGVGGRSYSLSSACATSTHSIGHGFELLRAGVIDLALVGGSEDVEAITAGAFCALRGAVSTGYNNRPREASRPFDSARDGFVLSRGGGVLVLEDWERAESRGAAILAEVLGFGANSDGHDLVQTEPSGLRSAACMNSAIKDAGLVPDQIDYINAHATSTAIGDGAEIAASRRVFGTTFPRISSTKSLNGHSLGAAGVHELIHCIAMLQDGFLAGSANLDQPAEEHADVPFLFASEPSTAQIMLSNSFGFGGTNATLVLGGAPD